MDICLIGKPSLDTAPKPKRAPKQKKVETVNSDSDSEFGVPKKTAPKGERLPLCDYLSTFHVQSICFFYSLRLERLGTCFKSLYSSINNVLRISAQLES